MERDIIKKQKKRKLSDNQQEHFSEMKDREDLQIKSIYKNRTQ